MSSKFVRIYDFDGTIYDGNSTLDFFRFEFKRNILNVFVLPIFLFFFIKFKTDRLIIDHFIEKVFKYLIVRTDLEHEAEIFWNTHYRKIKRFYFNNKKSEDIIISASPEFLLKPVCRRLNVKLIASRFDVNTRTFIGNICMDVEKIIRLNEAGVSNHYEFYTDSVKTDAPVIRHSKKAFLVKGEKIEMIWEKH